MPAGRRTQRPRLPFAAAVMKAVRGIPRGQVRSYSQVALMAGRPGAARGVGQLLATLPDVPWWRVVRADGSLAPAVAAEQKRKLAAEGHALRNDRLAAGRPTMAGGAGGGGPPEGVRLKASPRPAGGPPLRPPARAGF